jgi:N-acyl-D-aspartate/D-glutamate deacylase
MFSGTLLALLLAVSPQFDLIIRNARIVDGTGASWYRGAVAVKGDTIVAVAPRIEGDRCP